MSNMEFLDTQEAEKFKKQKWIQYCGTPCRSSAKMTIGYSSNKIEKPAEHPWQTPELPWKLQGTDLNPLNTNDTAMEGSKNPIETF